MPLLAPEKNFPLLKRIKEIKRHIYDETGLNIPPVYFKKNMALEENSYIIKIEKRTVSRGKIYPGRFLAIGPENSEEKIEGIKYREPAYGMAGLWIMRKELLKAEKLGCIVLDPVSVLSIHLTEVIRGERENLLDEQEVAEIINKVRKSHPALVKELYPEFIDIKELKTIFQNLLKEKISLKDIITILEVIADYANNTKDTDKLTEYVKENLESVSGDQ